MMGFSRTLLLFMLVAPIYSFLPTPTQRSRRTYLDAKPRPEYVEVDDNNDDNDRSTSPSASATTPKQTSFQDFSNMGEYVAIGPGSVVKIEVGDFALARKAQKKRRRSESPLMVPCSVISVNTMSAFRGNLIYILRKTGKSDVGQIIQAYKRTFCWAPAEWSRLVGFTDSKHIDFDAIFPASVQEAHGVQLHNKSFDVVYPKNPLQAVRLAGKSALLGFRQDPTDTTQLLHTGHVLLKGSATKQLSTALRLHQADATVQQGDQVYAVVSEFHPRGDGGEPLLKLTLNPSTVFRPATRIQQQQQRFIKDITDLDIGEELTGKVMRRVKNGVLVDCGIGRKQGRIPVWGQLNFLDAKRSEEVSSDRARPVRIEAFGDEEVEEEEEQLDIKSIDDLFSVLEEEEKNGEGEDITDMFSHNKDGSLTFMDPETGEAQEIDLSGDEEETTEEMILPIRSPQPKKLIFNNVQVEVGDEVTVYVKSIAAHSGQLSLSMDPSVRGKKSKEIKNDTAKDKKLSRLAKQLGGYSVIRKLRGQQSQGTVKATSKTGDWLYVQPEDASLPVGIATTPEDLDVGQGDSVRIQFDGVDEKRGQLAMSVLERLAP